MVPGLTQPPYPPAFSTAIASRDSTALAGIAKTRCGFLLGSARRTCYEDFLLELVAKRETRLAVGTLSRLAPLDASTVEHGHDYAHVIGINAWNPDKSLREEYLACTELYQSGCYHGVIQAYLTYRDADSATVAAACDQVDPNRANLFLRFQCVHALGHGLVMTREMHLPRALRGCDQLGNGWDRESCYGGAFMEFILGGRGQSHHVHAAGSERSRGDSSAQSRALGHEGHVHGMEDSSPPFKVRDTRDLLYPCSALASQYLQACYQMQAGIIVETTGLDFARVAKACDGAPDLWRPACYQGIGTYLSGVTVRNAQRSVALCRLGDRPYRVWCFVGVVKNFIDVTARYEDGVAFCREMPPDEDRPHCYQAVGEELSVLKPSLADREAACATLEAPFVDSCRFGAQLPRRDESPRS